MSKKIGGVRVHRRAVLEGGARSMEAADRALSEVIEQSRSLSLDSEEDRKTLLARLRYALCLDSRSRS